MAEGAGDRVAGLSDRAFAAFEVVQADPAERAAHAVDDQRVPAPVTLDLGPQLLCVGVLGGVEDLVELDVAHLGQAQQPHGGAGAEKLFDVFVRRVGEDFGGSGVLDDVAGPLHDRDVVADLERLVHVVGDEDDRLGQVVLEA